MVSLLGEGVSGEDRNYWTLLCSATLPGTNRPLGAGAVKINLPSGFLCMFSEETKAVPPLLLFSNVFLSLHHSSRGLCNWGGPHVMCLISLVLKNGLGEDSVPSISSRPQISTQSKTLNHLYKCDFRSPTPIPARFLEIL